MLIGGDAEFYDFQAKYLEADTAMAIPPPIGSDAIEEVRRLACAAFDALSCESLARVDFFYTPQGRIVLNEINTMPGFTSISMYSKMWEASGVAYADLVHRLIQLGLERHAQKRKLKTSVV